MMDIAAAWTEHAKKEITALRDFVLKVCDDYVKKLGYNCIVSPHDIERGGWGIAVELSQMDIFEDFFIINIVFEAVAPPSKDTVLFEIEKYWRDTNYNYSDHGSYEVGTHIEFATKIVDDVTKTLDKKLPKIIERNRKRFGI